MPRSRALDDVRAQPRRCCSTRRPNCCSPPTCPWRYARALRRYRYGSGVAKVDFALDGPGAVDEPRGRRSRRPCTSAAPATRSPRPRTPCAAGLQPGVDDAAPRHPYVLATQPTVVDPSRAPAGKHVLWAYTHVPAGSTLDATELVTREVERFAPGFRDLVLASAQRTATDLAAHNAQLRRRRHLRGRAHARAAREAAGRVDGAVAHAAAGRLPLLERDARPARPCTA